RGTGVDADHEGRRFRGGGRQHRATVTGPDIDRHPLEAGNDPGELTDVRLDEVPSDNGANHPAHNTSARP
ncbi:MAG: hypothetical protein ACHQDE_08175, partial [Acidimicrobiia bacterium]